MNKKRQHPDDRRYQILTAAIAIAERPGGYSKLTRKVIADEIGCAEALISLYFGTMPAFRRTIMRSAVITENLSILVQGIAIGDQHALKAPPELKARALQSLVE